MHFKHPELLYALLLLVIPILVHLFQLRRFRQEKFTNVKFLKKAVLQTRKSSRLKKWLILITRLFLLAAVILAFAQPYIPSKEDVTGPSETVIYLDNSYSMQARGQQGTLLRRSIQELLENIPPGQEFSFFTNSTEYPSVTLNQVRKDLQELQYAPYSQDWKSIELKATSLFSEANGIHKNFIAISDFLFEIPSEGIAAPEDIDYSLVHLIPENFSNAAIDTAFIASRNLDEIVLSVKLRTTGNSSENIPVALYNGDTLLAKKTMTPDESLQAVSLFSLPNKPVQDGRISIEDAGMTFDNELFFSINETDPVQVVAIGEGDHSFLERIYKAPDYDLQVFSRNAVDFNRLSVANLIVLNELDEIPGYLASNINSLLKEDVYFIIIPSEESSLQNYNSFFRDVNLPALVEKVNEEKLITGISYSHPLYEGVFDEKVENFEYPQVRSYYRINSTAIPVLSMDNGQPFLFQKDNFFVFSAAINRENSNFKNAPLIVPTFYNIGNMALSPSQLYYLLGKENKIDISASLEKDQILQIRSAQATFIPQQRSFQNKVEILLQDDPQRAGNFIVEKNQKKLTSLSFNIERDESRLDYSPLETQEGVELYREIPGVFRAMEAGNKVNTLWKWFVIFALVLLLLEMLILKYFK